MRHYSSGIFIGSKNYPFLSIGALTSEEQSIQDTPQDLRPLTIEEIIQRRQALTHAKVQQHVRAKHQLLEQLQDVAKSKHALESELTFLNTPSTLESFSKSLPHGKSLFLERFELLQTPKVKRKIEQLTADTDVGARTALQELQRYTDEHQLTQLLSTGLLGRKRKIVPTKWSITAVDDTLSTQQQEKILETDTHEETYYSATFLGNEFHIIIKPGVWSFELIEITLPRTIYNPGEKTIISKDHEYHHKRKKYVSETAGAYYAAKLAILEHVKKQGRVIVLRKITPAYTTPLGVWVIREGVRKALQHPTEQLSKEITPYLRESKLFQEQQAQLKTYF